MLITHVVYARGGKGGLWSNNSDPTTYSKLKKKRSTLTMQLFM